MPIRERIATLSHHWRCTISAFVHEVDTTGPATHVILVGLSDYPHLRGGSGALARWHFSLGQLSSPSASARALADWYIEEFDNPARPLASLSLLLSEPGDQGAVYDNGATGISHTVPRGNTKDLRSAVLRVLERSGPDDQLLFYFAGHGISAGLNDFYLLRDFGDEHDAPLDHMVNYSEFMEAMSTQIPSTQFYVFDACRDVDPRVDANTTGGTGLVTSDPETRLELGSVDLCSIMSTEKDARAYGPRGQPSVCAQAYLRAIAGAAGKKMGADWKITTLKMFEALKDFQTLGRGGHAGLKQVTDTDRFKDFPIRDLPGPPKVPVFLRRKDGASLKGSTLHYGSLGTERSERRALQLTEPQWEGLLDIGLYEFKVEVGPSRFLPAVSEMVFPTHLPLEVSDT